MECVIPGHNMKAMTKAIHALTKIGDEIYFQGKPDSLSLFTLNLNKTTYVTFMFLDSFFSCYSLSDRDGCTCKLLTKALAGIFKGHKEKKIEFCRLALENETTLSVKMKYKHDVIMTHELRLLEMEKMNLNVPKNIIANQIVSTSSCFGQLLNMFQSTDEDVSMDVGKSRSVVRNYENSSTVTSKTIRTQIALNPSEFNQYKIEQPTQITMSLKPLRAATQFAETFNINISLSFHTGGRPLILAMKSPTFEAHFVVSTMSPDGSTQSTATMTAFSAYKAGDFDGRVGSASEEAVDWENGDFGSGGKDKGSVGGVDVVVIPGSPESPKSKRARLILQRCFEPTFSSQMLDLGETLVGDSDVSDTER